MATMLVVVLSFGGAAESQLTIAVMPFNFSGGQWSGVDVGQQISNLVTDNLVNQGEFFVVERDLIQKIISEQDFGQSGRVDPCVLSFLRAAASVPLVFHYRALRPPWN